MFCLSLKKKQNQKKTAISKPQSLIYVGQLLLSIENKCDFLSSIICE